MLEIWKKCLVGLNEIENEPFEFSLGSPLEHNNKPVWGKPCD